MKIFDYRCGDCENVYEVFLRSDTIPTCTECGSTEKQVKLLSIGHVYVPDDDSPKTQKDLQNYLGNGQYVRGYQR